MLFISGKESEINKLNQKFSRWSCSGKISPDNREGVESLEYDATYKNWDYISICKFLKIEKSIALI